MSGEMCGGRPSRPCNRRRKFTNWERMKNMNQTQTRSLRKKVLSLILAVVMAVSLLPISAFASGNSTSTTASGKDYYKILHLDCGRKYFSKDWIIALLNEMSADGYNQLQLAFGNDGLRFLLDDMSFTANGTTYSHKTVVSKVEAGNKLQNNSGDASWLTQTEMDEIIAAAKEKGIEIVPLLNLPGHANAILDIADDTYNASGSNNTLNVASSEKARNFGMAIFKKYVDYFAGKGCKFFNFGADEYANDASGTFSFSRLNSTQYATFVSFINSLAEYIENKGVTARAFNDGLYYNGQSASIDTKIQCCYWSCGWGSSYPVAPAKTIASKGHDMINTNGDYYYVLGKADTFDSDYSSASNFSNAGFMGSTVNSPVGSMFCIWSDYPNAETEQVVAQKVRLPMRAMALRMNGESIDRMDTSVVANGFNADGTLNRAATGGDNTYTSEVDINLTVGQTSDVYTQAGDVTGKVNKDGFNETVASIVGPEYKQAAGTKKNVLGDKASMDEDGTYTGVIFDGTNYMIVNSSGIDSTTAIDKATKFTVTRTTTTGWFSTTITYTIQGDDGQFLKVTQSGSWYNQQYKLSTDTTAVDWSYSSRDGFSDSTYHRYITYNNGWNVSSGSGTGFLYGVTTEGTDPINETQITFKGNAVGETSVIIGSVKYNIKVTAEDLSKVTPLKLEYWITNSRLTGSDGNQALTIQATDKDVATEAGVSTADLVAKTGNKDGRTQEYWQTKILDVEKKNNSTSGTELQVTKQGDDETLNGKAFTKVRYWGGAWQVYTTEWVNVDRTATSVKYTDDKSNTQTYTGDKNQLVAYYMEVVDIKNSNGTTNLHVNAADWGTKGDGTGNWGYPPEKNRCSVSVQLVYEDSSTNPADTTADSLKSKAIVYGYWSGGRGLGTMIFNGEENYQIIKVTAETGTMESSASGSNTVTVTKFKWAKNEETVWEGAATDSVSIGNPARNPSYEAPYDNLAWNTGDYNHNNAILIRVYVKAIPKSGALTVNYFAKGSTEPFYHYGINVEEKTVFDTGFARVTDKDAPGGAKLINNTVKNYAGETQTIQSDLSKMTEIGAQYRYSNYTFTEAERSTDGKTVNLYYTFNWNKAFVVDFGLPVVIRPNDVNENLKNATLTAAEITQSTTYANISVDNDKNITYTLKQTIDGEDNFSVRYMGNITTDTGTQTGQVDYSIKVIPATSVYYEDSFATFTNANGTKNVAQVDNVDKGIWTKVTDGTTQTNVNQALEALGGTTNTKNVYGYDPAYAGSSKFSMGSATKVTVNANTANNGQWPTATFTFKGTGFDVISLTDNNSGAISVKVYSVGNDGTETQVKGTLVNNYYGYTCKDGKWTATPSGDNNALYQIPVIKISGLDYGTYKVVITASYATFADKTGDGQYNFWLDAIRVYDPMGKDNATYEQENEGYPQYIKLRDSLAKDHTATAKEAVFIDGGATANIQTYANYGPNNEVYLANGQAITFTIPENTNIASIQIGAKAPNGDAAEMDVNGTKTAIPSATEMYYQIATQGNQSFTVTNTGNDLLSLTNLKITFKTNPNTTVTLAALSDEDQANAVAQVRALFAAPVEPFNPDLFTASWGHSVRKGDTATLTVKASEDVEAIEVDGQMIDKYVTRTERSGWGWWAKTVTFREFTYTDTATVTKDYTVCAVNGKGVSSDAITATLTVRPSVRDWLHGIIGKWF